MHDGWLSVGGTEGAALNRHVEPLHCGICRLSCCCLSMCSHSPHTVCCCCSAGLLEFGYLEDTGALSDEDDEEATTSDDDVAALFLDEEGSEEEGSEVRGQGAKYGGRRFQRPFGQGWNAAAWACDSAGCAQLVLVLVLALS